MAEKIKWTHYPPYGYKFDKENKKFVIIPEKEKTLRTIFELYLKKVSSREIAIFLNSKGFPTARGGKWAYNTVENLLTPTRLEFYYGFYQGKSGNWEPMIDKKTYEKLCSVYSPPPKRKREHKKIYLLTRQGNVFCGYCGGTVKANITRRATEDRSDYHYSCTTKHMYGTCTKSKFVQQKLVDAALLNDVTQKAKSISGIKGFTEVSEKKILQKFLKDTNEINEKLNQLYTSQKNVRSKVKFLEYENEIKKLTEIKNTLISSQRDPFDFDSLKTTKFKRIKSLPMLERKKLLNEIIERIDIYSDYIKITYKFFIGTDKSIVEVSF